MPSAVSHPPLQKLKGDGSTALLFEFGEICTHLLLVSGDGVEAVRATAVTMDKVAEAVQVELGLKFKGSAAKLFFNESYDFSETGSKIGARIAQELTADVGALGHSPAAFACTGLPAKQNCFASHLAGALNLAPFAPDLKNWCAQTHLTFSDSTIESSLTPAWLGFLHFIGSYQVASPEKSVWQPDWTRTTPPPAAPAPAAVISPPKPAAASVIAPPKPAGIVPPAAPAKPAPPLFTPTPPKPAGTVPPAAPARPAPPLFTPTPPKPAGTVPPAAPARPGPPLFTPTPPKPVAPATTSLPVKPATPSLAKPAAPPPAKPIAAPPPRPIAAPPPRPVAAPPPKPVAAPAPAKPAPAPAPAPAPKPVAAVPPKPVAAPSSFSAKPSFIKSTAGMATMAIAALVLIVGVYFAYSSHEKAAEEAAALIVKQQHDAAVAAQKQLADQQAQAAAAFQKAQEEAAAKLAAVEAQAKAAEEKARIEEAAHLADARGQVNIATDPAGATIAIGDLPTRTSPSLFTNLKIGNYPVTISLPDYEPAKLNIEVKENETVDPGVIKLARQTGSIELTSEPAGASYSVRSASNMLLLNTSGLSGTTPATIGDLPTGDYVVTFSREGFQPHDETVTVSHDTPAQASWKFLNGNVLVTSTPSGATVTTSDGRVLGVTPVTINDVEPGDISYTVTLDGYDPATITGKVEGGKTNTLDTTLLSVNRLANLTDLDAQPQPIDQPQPQISSRITDSGVVEINFTVDRSGNVKDLEVIKNTTNNPVVAHLCLAAVSQWKYKPGLIDDKPVNVRETVPFTINP